ncbi:MAG: glutathione S-transferase N-terminal domain-containing protein [Acidobacteria bacterium]|nr:glutathione S-transferase N-terminal domain-containing protein [Acidobacteriota bacterium]
MTIDANLILYIGEKNISSWSMRGWLAMHIKELSFEERTIELRTDKDRRRRREVSPTGRVPALHHGDLAIPDSLAIIEYLEETFPAPWHPPLWPIDKPARAHARWLAAAMHSGFLKLREGMSFNLCFLPTPPKPRQEALQEAAEMLGYFEAALSRKATPGDFLFGGFGAVDAMFAPAVVRLTAFDVPTRETPRAAAYLQAVLNHPPVARWLREARALPPRETY